MFLLIGSLRQARTAGLTYVYAIDNVMHYMIHYSKHAVPMPYDVTKAVTSVCAIV